MRTQIEAFLPDPLLLDSRRVIVIALLIDFSEVAVARLREPDSVVDATNAHHARVICADLLGEARDAGRSGTAGRVDRGISTEKGAAVGASVQIARSGTVTAATADFVAPAVHANGEGVAEAILYETEKLVLTADEPEADLAGRGTIFEAGVRHAIIRDLTGKLAVSNVSTDGVCASHEVFATATLLDVDRAVKHTVSTGTILGQVKVGIVSTRVLNDTDRVLIESIVAAYKAHRGEISVTILVNKDSIVVRRPGIAFTRGCAGTVKTALLRDKGLVVAAELRGALEVCIAHLLDE